MKRSTVVFALCVLAIISVSGCNKKDSPATASQAEQPAPGIEQASLSGKVMETMSSGGYTYISLENNGQKMWVAIPQTDVKVGQAVTCQPGMVMENFTSKTLNRTFDSIVFSGGIL